MASSDHAITVPEPPQAAIQRCVRALTTAGFKNITADANAMIVTAQKRAFGQWTRSGIALTVEPAGDESKITVLAQATRQSITSLAASPSDRMVQQVLRALGG